MITTHQLKEDCCLRRRRKGNAPLCLKRFSVQQPLTVFILCFLGIGVGINSAANLHVYPTSLDISSAADVHRLMGIAVAEDGVTQDVTESITWASRDPAVLAVDGQSVRAISDVGETEVIASWEDQEVRIPVVIRQGTQQPPISFRLDVMPTITKAGCNTGTCHGASRGKDGFGLSLFGFDPAGDYHRLTRENAARRINLAVPADSLLLQKAIGGVQHTGGKRFEPDSAYYQTLHRWLEQGAKNDDDDVARVTSVDLFPPEIVLQGFGGTQPLMAIAHYSDGTDRDVTDLAVFLSRDESVASLAGHVVTGSARGESFVTARFETHTVGIPALVLPETVDYQSPTEEELADGNYIDRLVADKLRKLRVPASPVCSDDVFLRRVTVDTIGLLPTEEDYQTLMADHAEGKRARIIERLLQRAEFAELWGTKWADLLMIRMQPNRMSDKAVLLYSQWLRDKIAAGARLDEMVRELLTATGHSFTTPAANYFVVERDKLKVAENVAQTFLGIRTQCAQCHNHPFDRWTMDDYYGFAAFFARVGMKPHEDYRQWIVFSGGGQTIHPVTKKAVVPKYLGGAIAEIPGGIDPRVPLAEWLTSPDNPYFARAAANRVWHHFLGMGIIEPVDDVRVSNPPSNQALLDELARRLIEYEYDFRRLAKDILMSRTYQRSSRSVAGNEQDERNFARAAVRRIPADSLLDCISQVTESPTKYRGRPLGTRALQTADHAPESYFLTTFGRSSRASVCACETNSTPTLSQALHLLNGDSIDGKIRQGKWVASELAAEKSPIDILQSLTIRCLGREPTAEEIEFLTEQLVDGQPQDELEDLFWAILNSREFLFLK